MGAVASIPPSSVAAVEARLDEAYRLHREGRFAEAWALYRAAAAEAPARGDTRRLMAILRFQIGDRATAAALARQAVCVEPDRVETYPVLLTATADDEATVARLARRGLILDPCQTDIAMVAADISFRRGALDGGIAVIRRALVVDPTHRRGLSRVAEVERHLGRFDRAAVWLRRVAATDGGDAALMFRLATTRERAGRSPDGAYRACLAHDPACAEALFNLANGLSSVRGQEERAARLIRAAALARWDFVEAASGLGSILYARHRLGPAAAAFRRAVALDPGRGDALLNFANLLQDQGEVEGATTVLGRMLTLTPDHPVAFTNLLFTACFREGMTGAALLDLHREFDRRFARPVARPPRSWPGRRDPRRRIRLGFLSPSFRRHPGGSFLLPFVNHVDRAAFETHLYYNGTHEDDLTRRFRALADGWHPCRDMDDATLAARIEADGIDILVDCAGHLADSRLLVFARRAAPVQVSFPIYPATTGIAEMDYRIMDPYFAPPFPEGDGMHSETLIRLPDCHVCYRPLDIAVEPAEEPPMRRNGYVTLASFNNFAKTGPETMALWAEVLERVPDARLILKWQGLGGGDLARRRLRALYDRGIDPARVTLLDWTPDPYTPYRDVDLCLDPVHANGGTTTCDALWMGVPVVTLVGALPFARVGLCHLSNVGLTETIARDPAEYVDIVAGLAAAPDRLAALRRGLRDRFAASPLMDAPRYARHLERAFRDVWRAWCDGAGAPAADDGPAVDRLLSEAFRHHTGKRLDEAAAWYREVLIRMPGHLDALHLRGVVARQAGDGPTATRWIGRALRARSDFPSVWYNYALAWRESGRPDLCARAQRRTIALTPDGGGAYTSLGTAEQAHLRVDRSETAWRRAIRLDAADADAHLNLAWVLLITGRYAEGWPEFEWRWRREDFTTPRRAFPCPLWMGEPLDGRTILIHAEQGFGDTVQMLRYVPLVAARGGRVVVEAHPALAPLIADRFGGADVAFAPLGSPLPDFDLHCPFMSLPLAFGTTLDTIPAPRSYLRSAPERVARWAPRLEATPAGGAGGRVLKVGLLWAGNPHFKGDRDRSPRLAPLLGLLRVPGVRFFGLQMGEGRRDMEGVDLPPDFVDLGAEIGDFGDSAAIMSGLDLVVTSCSAPAHLAGALGVPTWLLLTYAPDWRWLLEREDSPWYPSVRLYRQAARGDWAGVAARVTADLRRLVGSSVGRGPASGGRAEHVD